MAISLYTPDDVLKAMQERLRALRLAQGLTQEGLARRSGVSLGSVKRFETTGQISFESLLKLAQILGRIDDFHHLAESLVAAQLLTLEGSDSKPLLLKRGRRA